MLKNLFQTKIEDGAVWVVKELLRGLEGAGALDKSKIKNDVFDLLKIVKDESTASEIMDLLKSSFTDSLTSLKKQLKMRKKDYKDELPDHITNDPIIPFIDSNSNTRCYYNAEKDILNFGIDKEIIKEMMLSYGLSSPDNYPTFSVKFDPFDMGGKFDLYGQSFNLFTPTDYMYLEI